MGDFYQGRVNSKPMVGQQKGERNKGGNNDG
jgi:hypothetical protein